MKYIPSILAFLLFISCESEDVTESTTSLTALVNGKPWHASSINVRATSGIDKIIATNEDDGLSFIFSIVALGLTPDNKTSEFRSRGAVIDNFWFEVLAENEVILRWTTTEESNMDYFEIQYSENGESFFAWSRVWATGNSTSVKHYDSNSIFMGGSQTLYFRLRVVDVFGNDVLTEPLTVTTNFPVLVKLKDGFSTTAYSGKVQLSEFNYMDKVISGTFNFRYQDNTGFEVVVTEGKFEHITY